MVIGLDSRINVNGFTEIQTREIRAYLQGVVYCWCKNKKDEWFAARDLLGGDNNDWRGTPLQNLHEYYLGRRDDDGEYAVSEAGKTAGRLLRNVLVEDRRIFETRVRHTREYLWTGNFR